MPRARVGPVGLVGVVAVAALFVSTSVAPHVYATLLIANIAWVATAGWATLACASAARAASAPWRRGWGLLAVTCGLWFVANLWWSVYDVVLRIPIPTPAPVDALYLLAQVTAVLAVFTLVRPLVLRDELGRTIVDTVLVGASFAYLSATILFGDPAGGIDDPLGRLVAWAYPVSDVLLVAVALIAVSRSPRSLLRVGVPLAVGFAALGIGDSLWAVNVLSDHPVGAALSSSLYVVAYLGVVRAARARHVGLPPDLGPAPAWVRSLAYLAVVAAVVDLLWRNLHDPYPGILGGVVIAVLVVRQVVAIAENLHLRRDLEVRVIERTSELAASEALFRTMSDTISDAVFVFNADGSVRFASPGMPGIANYDLDISNGAELLRFVHPDDLAVAMSLLESAPGAAKSVRLRLCSNDGRTAVADATLIDLTDDPSIAGFMLVLRDVTDAAALEHQLRHRVDHDDLTGLPNRSVLRDRLAGRLAAGGTPGVVLLDLDAFKNVNDNLGHDVGDALLIAVGQILRDAVGVDGLIARVSGDEFAVVVTDAAAAFAVADRLHDALCDPVQVGARSIRCQASIGVATIGDDSDTLLRNADLAMYEAKQRGKARVEEYRPRMHERVARRLELEEGLAAALASEELGIMYQPVVDVRTGQVLGAEALLRWDRPNGETVDPEEFIPVAEETGLIDEIGRWVLREACATAAGWQDVCPIGSAPTIAVNVSVCQMVDHDLVGEVAEALRRSGLPAACLTLEVTETSLMEDGDAVLDQLNQLKALGVRLSIDDFGTGYSSLGRLRFLPFDEVKIDRSFVSAARSELDMPVVRAVVAMAASLGLDVVAEGVEHPTELRLLRMLGCGRAQGFHLGRPMAALALEAALWLPIEVGNEALNFPV